MRRIHLRFSGSGVIHVITRATAGKDRLPGVTPVKPFTDRKTPLDRIWKTLENGSAHPNTRSKTPRKSSARAKTTGV
jgi:hypothetical protein